MSADTTPDQRHLRDVEALGDEARPDQDVEVAPRRTRRARARRRPCARRRRGRGGPIRSDGNRSRTSRSTRSVPPPRYRIRGDAHAGQRVAGGQARPQWWQRSDGAGLVVDERPVAVGARLDVAAVAAHDDRRRAAPVDHEDRAVAVRGVERRRAPSASASESSPRLPAASSARMSTTMTRGSVPGRPHGQHGAPVPPGPRVAHALDRRRGAPEHDRRARRSRRGRPPRRAPGTAASGRSCTPASCSSSTTTSPTSSSGASSAVRVPTTTSAPPARIRRHSSARSPSPSAECRTAIRDGEVGAQPVDDRRRERDLRHEQQRRAARREARRDRLDVDRGLAAAGDAVEQDRRRVAVARWRRGRGARAAAWAARQARTGRPGAAHACGPVGQRAVAARSRTSARTQAAPHEPGDRRRPVALGQRPGRRAVDRGRPPTSHRSPSSSSSSADRCRGPSGRPGGRSPRRSCATAAVPSVVSHSRRS